VESGTRAARKNDAFHNGPSCQMLYEAPAQRRMLWALIGDLGDVVGQRSKRDFIVRWDLAVVQIRKRSGPGGHTARFP
jgi:hypothetical protein